MKKFKVIATATEERIWEKEFEAETEEEAKDMAMNDFDSSDWDEVDTITLYDGVDFEVE